MQARAHAPLFDVEAPYVAEMARLELRQRYGPSVETAGYRVYTTIDGQLQAAANRAVRVGLIEYDRRHGWRGPAGHVELPAHGEPDYDDLVDEYSAIGNLSPAVVVSVAEKSARAYVKSLGTVQIDWDGLSWAHRQQRNETPGPPPKDASQVLSRGDVVYVVADAAGHAQLAQIPEAQSALVALDPNDGSIGALVGGFDYFTNKYNRVTQARRLPGSGFKPFLYSAALENGFTPASVLLDAPIVLDGSGSEEAWRPENSTREFSGPTRLREAPGAGAALRTSDRAHGEPAPLPETQAAPRVISAQNAYLMADMMSDVIKRGTGRRALALGRGDIAGKTGTTNEARDTWFNGFTRNLVATVWVSFDQERPLGEAEEGARTALPIWMQFMREALKGVPEQARSMPDGLVTLRISPQTGTLVSAENPDGIPEIFMANHLPSGNTGALAQGPEGQASGEPIF